MTRTVMNRVLLALVGLVLLGGGGLLLIGGLNLNQRWHLGLPAHWSVTQPHHAVLTAAQRAQWRDHSWWWPTVFAGLAVLTLLSLWWLIGQLYAGHGRGSAGTRPRPGSAFADSGPRQRTRDSRRRRGRRPPGGGPGPGPGPGPPPSGPHPDLPHAHPGNGAGVGTSRAERRTAGPCPTRHRPGASCRPRSASARTGERCSGWSDEGRAGPTSGLTLLSRTRSVLRVALRVCGGDQSLDHRARSALPCAFPGIAANSRH